MEYVTLNNGLKMPMVGLGTYPLKGEILHDILRVTYDLGYRLYDTAWLYKNETDINKGLNKAGIKRENVFITSKLHRDDIYWAYHPHYHMKIRSKSVKRAFENSCKRLGTDYLDLFLIHYPFDGYEWMWEDIVKLYKEGRIKAIGVSSFKPFHLEKLKQISDIVPAVNQIELNPFTTRKDILEYCKNNGITVEAFSPFGRGLLTKQIFEEPILNDIAMRTEKSVAQVILRWVYQLGIVSIPRSNKTEKLKQNIDIFNFNLSESDMTAIDGLNRNMYTSGGILRIE